MTTHPAIRGHSERICSNCGTRPYDHLPHVRITSTSRAQTIITSLERQNLDNRDLVRIAAAEFYIFVSWVESSQLFFKSQPRVFPALCFEVALPPSRLPPAAHAGAAQCGAWAGARFFFRRS